MPLSSPEDARILLLPASVIGALLSSELVKGIICTSTTRPGTNDRYEGLLIYETDTNTFNFWDGAAWTAVGGGGGAPSGPAGGALDGTYPSPGIAASVAGGGLTEVANVLAVGAGTGITVNADDVAVNIPSVLTGAVILAPASSTRNVIQPTGDFIGLVLKKAAGTPASRLLEMQSAAGTPVAWLTKDGHWRAEPGSVAAVSYGFNVGGDDSGMFSDGGGTNVSFAVNGSEVLRLEAAGGQKALFNSATNATKPDLTFFGDDNTGIYRAGADILGLCAGGSEELRVTAGPGKVTINNALKITNASTAGQVWTATDAIGNGGWAAAGGPPSGAAGGALDGTYPSPGLNASVAGAGLTEAADVLAVGAGLGIKINANDVELDAAAIPWIPMFDSHVNLSAAAAGTYVGHRAVTEDLLIGAASPAVFAAIQHYIDPADYAVTGRTMKMRVIASFMQNTVANAATSVATAGLYPVVPGGGTTTWAPTLGAVIAGSTAAKTGGAASSESRVVSSTFTAPTADTYMLAVAITVATTAGATKISMRLEYTYA